MISAKDRTCLVIDENLFCESHSIGITLGKDFDKSILITSNSPVRQKVRFYTIIALQRVQFSGKSVIRSITPLIVKGSFGLIHFTFDQKLYFLKGSNPLTFNDRFEKKIQILVIYILYNIQYPKATQKVKNGIMKLRNIIFELDQYLLPIE